MHRQPSACCPRICCGLAHHLDLARLKLLDRTAGQFLQFSDELICRCVLVLEYLPIEGGMPLFKNRQKKGALIEFERVGEFGNTF